jgi:hypothetical protein
MSDPNEARLLEVIAKARFDVLPNFYVFQDLVAGHPPTPAALACVRDGDSWSELVPAIDDQDADATHQIMSFHFAEDVSASGFVGWLASHLKRSIGTGVIVICGRDARGARALWYAAQGVFDYWGVPARVGPEAIAEIRSLIERGRTA